jgi:hypothetical protein
MNLNDSITLKGNIRAIIEDDIEGMRTICFHNDVLKTGREAIAAALANQVGSTFEFYINRMLFGDGGTNGGVPKIVNENRNGLFGVTRVNKPIIATIDPTNPAKVSLTSVVTRSEGNGYALNEMALQMANGDIYSMATFEDLNKTSSMQITWVWDLTFI